jgi:hypothetical protein
MSSILVALLLNLLSDKHLQKEGPKSYLIIRSTPIADLYSQAYSRFKRRKEKGYAIRLYCR